MLRACLKKQQQSQSMDRTWRLTAVTLQPKLTGSTVSPGLFCVTDPALWRVGEGASPLSLSASVWLVGAELGGPSGPRSFAAA